MTNENSVLVVKNLNRWFKEKWVDVSRKDPKTGKHPPCGRSKAKKGSKGYPKCRPSVRVSSKTPKTSGEMTSGQKQAATKRKRAKKQGVGGKPTIVKSVLVKAPRIPRKKGQPANSKKHSDLYTDENPKGTIHGLGFKNPAKAKQSVSKIKSSSRSHAHKTQAAIAMEQRAKEMGKNSAAKVYRKFIEEQKKKTKSMKKMLKEDTFVPIGQYGGRKIAMFNGKPYYISKEGTTGKKKGQWYGFGGIEPDASQWGVSPYKEPWFIKGNRNVHEDIPPHAHYVTNDKGETVHGDIRSEAGRVGAHAERHDGEYPFLRSEREVNQLLSQHGFTPAIRGDYPTEVLKGDCPTPSKGKYSNQAAAQRAADYQSQQSGRPISVYRCQQVGGGGCGFWHLTSG